MCREMKTWENIVFCRITFVNFLYVLHSMYIVNEVMNCFICNKTWLRRLHELKHAGHVLYGVQYKINDQFYIHFESTVSAIYSTYISTNL